MRVFSSPDGSSVCVMQWTEF